MNIGARTAAWSGKTKIPAIWIGSGTSYFDSEVMFGDGHVIVDIEFYRKIAQSEGQYIFGGYVNNNNSRFDACYYNNSYWFVGYGHDYKYCYFSDGAPVVYNSINSITYDVDYASKKISFLANGHVFLDRANFDFTASSFSPYIGARRYDNSITKPSHDVGIVSINIIKNGSPFRKYRPFVQNGVIGLVDEVNNVFHGPLSGGNNLTYIDDIEADGVML